MSVITQPVIAQPELGALLPHSGAMCLLEQVVSWDQQTIECRSGSHRAGDNPLRSGNCLPVEAGIEYAAQAMAIHGSLSGRQQAADQPGTPRIGYLAVLSQVEWVVPRLDDINEDLVIRAECLAASAQGSQYQFSLSAAGNTLLSGQALVALAETPNKEYAC